MSESPGQAAFGAASTGILQLLPMYIRPGTQVQALTASILPWGAPGLSGAVGLTAVTPQEPLLLLAYEWPMPWFRPVSRISKAELESLHLYRYSTDHRLALGVAPFGNATPGANPPDHQVSTDAGSVGIECSAFTVQARRDAHALFSNLRRRVALIDPPALAHLAGYMVYLWFPATAGMSLPFKPNDEQAISELLQALFTYRPNPGQLAVTGGGMPEVAPDLGAATTSAGATFYAVPQSTCLGGNTGGNMPFPPTPLECAAP